MTLHRQLHHGSRLRGARLALKDQLDLQQVIRHGLRVDGPGDFYFSTDAGLLVQLLQRHGVDVTLNPHDGLITFNPEVIDA